MDEELNIIPAEEETQQAEPIIRNFATVGAVYTDGVSLIFDGESEPTQKHYLCNTMMYCRPGDRVKIVEDSGTYVVEYVVGAPLQTELHGLPTGGVAGQILQKMSDAEFHAAWKTLKGLLPTGGTTGQLLQKSSSANYAAAWVNGYLVPSGGTAGQVLIKDTATNGDVSWGAPTVGNIVNQYNSGSNYVIQFRTTSTYGTGASTFQIRMGTSGTWYTLAKA